MRNVFPVQALAKQLDATRPATPEAAKSRRQRASRATSSKVPVAAASRATAAGEVISRLTLSLRPLPDALDAGWD